MPLDFLLHVRVPPANLRVLQQVIESIAAFDTAQDSVNGKIGQVGFVSAHESSALCFYSLGPPVAFVVERLPDVVLQVVSEISGDKLEKH